MVLDFEYSSTIQLDDHYPVRVQTSETTIGVSCGGATFFYDLKTRVLKCRHNNYGTSNINYIDSDSTFYGSKFKESKFFFFDYDGNFIEEMEMNENFSEHINTDHSGSLCRRKDNL